MANNSNPISDTLAYVKTSLVNGQPAPLTSGAKGAWLIGKNRDVTIQTQLGIWVGDITDARNFDVWVNPENTDMEMAHFHMANISGIIRFLGAKSSRAYGDSDDKIYRALLNEVSRKWGVLRPVPAASVYLTTSGQLKKTHNIKIIAHVACVEPKDASRPGSGIVPVQDIGQCVSNILGTIDAANRKRARYQSVLIPLLATGTGGGDPRAHSEIIVSATENFLLTNPQTLIQKISFLAWDQKQNDLFRHAIENLDNVQPLSAQT